MLFQVFAIASRRGRLRKRRDVPVRGRAVASRHMGITRTPKLSPAKLKEAFVTDLVAAWEAERAARGKETPYAFVLYGVEGGNAWLWPYVLTDEGLNQVAMRYLKEGYHETIEEARDALRWSVADAPGVQRGPEAELPNVEAVFAPHAEALGETERYRVLAKSATEALKALDRRGTFGKGAARAKITLVIVTEDTADDSAKPSAKALNPPAVFKRFERQTRIEGTFKSNDAIAIAPDGRRLYAAGSRNLSEDEDDDVNEIVAMDLRGRRLERRWAFSFPTFGDSVNEMAVTGDGRSLFVVRGRIEGDDDDALVMRFGRDRNKPLAEYSVPQGGTFAMTADGSRCAVATSGKELVLLDGDTLRELGRRKIGVQALSMHFCSRRDLLVGTEKGIFRLDPEGDGPPRKVADGYAHGFSVDDAGKLIAVSRWFDLDEQAVRRPPAGPGVVQAGADV